MRRQLALIPLIATCSLPVTADILGGEVGVNYWHQSYDARVRLGGEHIDLDSTFDIDNESDYQVYVALEHPIPLIPNLLLQHTKVDTRGTGVLDIDILGPIGIEENVTGTLELTHTDATVYWEILDNQVSLDLGASIRVFDGGVVLTAENGNSADLELDDVVPMLYGSVRFDLPFSGWHLQADGNWIAFDGDKVFDAKAAVAWEFPLGVGAELGYRYMDIDYKVSGGQLDALTDGVYLGLYWDF
jgi:outer membrane protein